MAGHRPLNHDEPQPEGDLADPPPHLTARQQYYWREAIKHAPAGMLKNLDAGALQVYVIAQARLERASRKVDELGELVQAPGRPKGTFIQNPYVVLERNAQALVLKAGAELGFSPSSRSRVKISNRKKPGRNPFGRLRQLDAT